MALFSIIFTACASAESSAVSTPKIDSAAKDMYLKRMIPAPKEFALNEGRFFRIAKDCNVEIIVPSTIASSKESIKENVSNIFKSYWDIIPFVKIADSDASKDIKKDGYQIEVTEQLIKISASEMGGVRNALKSIRQLSESERGSEKFNAYVLPQFKMNDFPSLQFRGIHICYFPETTFYEFVRAIRLADYYKMNFVVVEFWGTYKFKNYPEFCWDEYCLSDSQIDEIVALSQELGITIIPQFNMLGHASGAREIAGKHSVLYKHKNLQNHFEPEGWSWCISNPATQEMLKNMMIDLHSRFGNPPFFHIGFDESYDVGTCSLCRKTGTQAELIKKFIMSLHSTMQKRNARLIMWHDMLLDKEDLRWKFYNVCGHAEQNLTNLHNELPKDILIADWQYGYPKPNGKPPTWPTSIYFTQKGFDTVVCPWLNNDGIVSLGEFAKNNNLYGVLATTWGQMHATNIQKIFSQNATVQWGATALSLYDRKNRMSFNHHINQLDWDMKCSKYKDSGYSNNEDLKNMK